MSKTKSDPKVLTLDDLEDRLFWAGIVMMLGLAMAAVGATWMASALRKSIDQVDELSGRVERLTAEPSQSEPTKTSR